MAVALFTACASGGASPPGGAQQAAGAEPPAREGSVVLIRNTVPSSSTINVFMVPDVGVDIQLGVVDGGQSAEFPFNGPPGQYTLRATGPAGQITSERFQAYRNSLITWDISLGRRVRVGSRR
jgi:hypothetical protein